MESALETFGDDLFISTFVMPDRPVSDPEEDILFIMEYAAGGSASNPEDWLYFQASVQYDDSLGGYSSLFGYFADEARYAELENISPDAYYYGEDIGAAQRQQNYYASVAEEITQHTFGAVDVECHWIKSNSTAENLGVYDDLYAYFTIDDRCFIYDSSVRLDENMTQAEAEEAEAFLMDSLEWLFSEECERREREQSENAVDENVCLTDILGYDELYDVCYDMANNDQKLQLENIQVKEVCGTKGNGNYVRDILIIMDEIPADTPRLTKEDAIRICESIEGPFSNMREKEFAIVELLNEIAGAPDYDGGSGVQRRIYLINETGSEYVKVSHGRVRYVNEETGESVILYPIDNEE